MPDFECRLKKYRLLKDLTQEQLAAQVGVRARNNYAAGKRHNTIPHLNWRLIFQELLKHRLKKYSFSSDLCMYFDKFNNAPSFLCYGYDF